MEVTVTLEQIAQISRVQRIHNCSWEDAYQIFSEDTTHLDIGE